MSTIVCFRTEILGQDSRVFPSRYKNVLSFYQGSQEIPAKGTSFTMSPQRQRLAPLQTPANKTTLHVTAVRRTVDPVPHRSIQTVTILSARLSRRDL